jgi:hypothetical protein
MEAYKVFNRNKVSLRSTTMTTATKNKIPTIHATSTPNFYDVLSSDNRTHYPMLVEGPGQVRCGCPAGEAGRQCYHRRYAVAFLIYIDPEISLRFIALEEGLKEINAVLWQAVQEQAEKEAELDEVRTLFDTAA